MSYFITLEGPDGSGKSTQAKLLAEHLQRQGYDIHLTREPGGSPIGDQIRQILFAMDNRTMHPRTEFLLFTASRAQHVHQIIRPHLEAGGIVISDRFHDSSLAYQGYGHQLNLDTLRSITTFATGGLTPDLTLLLDLPVEVGLRRRMSEGDWNRLDDYDLAFHHRVREGYRQLARQEPERWVTISAQQPPRVVHTEIRRIVNKWLDQRQP